MQLFRVDPFTENVTIYPYHKVLDMQILILLHLIIMELCGLQDKVEYMEDCFHQQEQWKYLMHLMVQALWYHHYTKWINILWSLAGSYVGRIDTTTGQVTVLEPPTLDQGARRVWSDSDGNIWVSEWNVR